MSYVLNVRASVAGRPCSALENVLKQPTWHNSQQVQDKVRESEWQYNISQRNNLEAGVTRQDATTTMFYCVDNVLRVYQ